MYTHPSYRDRLPTTGIIPAPLKLAAIPWPDAAYNPRSPGKSNTHIMAFGCKWGILQKGCQHINHWILNDIKVSQLQTKPHQTIIFVDPLYWQNMDFFPIVPQTQFLRVTNCLPVRLSAIFLLPFKLKLSGNTCLGQNQTNLETQGDDNYNNDQHLQSRQMVWRFNI